MYSINKFKEFLFSNGYQISRAFSLKGFYRAIEIVSLDSGDKFVITLMGKKYKMKVKGIPEEYELSIVNGITKPAETRWCSFR